MFKKEFILDDGEIRNCASNIAKMNVLEYIVFNKFFIKDIWYSVKECLDEIFEGFIALYYLFFSIVCALIFPICFPLIAYFRIRKARKEVARCKICGER